MIQHYLITHKPLGFNAHEGE